MKKSTKRKIKKLIKKALPTFIFILFCIGFMLFQINYSKDHHLYLSTDDGIWYHDCGYGFCRETTDENGVKCFYCTHCEENIYK